MLVPAWPTHIAAGVHDFDELLKLRSRPAGNYSSSVALLLFSKPYAVMLQNSGGCCRVAQNSSGLPRISCRCAMEADAHTGSRGKGVAASAGAGAAHALLMSLVSLFCPCTVYSLVKHGGVRNYIALAWSAGAPGSGGSRASIWRALH